MANGAFGQVRLAKDNVTDEDLAVKLENSNAKMPMLFLEYRFYKVMYIPLYDGIHIYLEIQLIISITDGDNTSYDFVGHRK